MKGGRSAFVLVACIGTLLLATARADASPPLDDRVGPVTSHLGAWRAPAPAAVSGAAVVPVRLWVVPVYWASVPPPLSVRTTLAASTRAAAAFFTGESAGRASVVLAGVRPYLKVARVKRCATEAAERAARQSLGLRLKPATDIVITWTPSVNCVAAGRAWFGGGPVWVQTADQETIAHELGHSLLSLGHDGSVSCRSGETSVTMGGTCTYREYGDPYSVMGNETMGGLPASTLIGSRWRSLRQRVYAVRSGVFTLVPRASTSGVTSLLVPWPGNAYYGQYRLELEYRTASGRDAWLGSTDRFGARGGAGVLVRVPTYTPWTKDPSLYGGLGGHATGLLNMYPELMDAVDGSVYSPAMRPGDRWTTPDGLVTVAVVGMDAASAKVEVTHVPDTRAPFPFRIAAPDLVRRVGQYRIVRLSWNPKPPWEASGPDDLAVHSVRTRIDSGPWVTQVRRSWESGPSTWRTARLRPGAHRVTVVLTDTAGNVRSASRIVRVR